MEGVPLHFNEGLAVSLPASNRRAPDGRAPHFVQFYEDEAYLVNRVTEFGGDALGQGQSFVLIATPEHTSGILRGLAARGLDLHDLRRRGRLTTRDAREMLSHFVVGGTPVDSRFMALLRPLIERSQRASDGGGVRAFGEMVQLLWRDGNLHAALRLEELWNDLGRQFDFGLLCAYDLRTFDSASHSEAFGQICGRHTHVRPSGRYLKQDDEARLVEISLLEQRARALEAEIEQRKQLEERLRKSGAEQLALLESERAARADAEAANRAKSEFLAVMSHELRTPLNAIGGHVQLLEMGLHGPISEAQRAALGRITTNQLHLLSLINDVLNLSRIERGRVDFELAPVELAPIVAEVAATLEPLLHSNGLRFALKDCGDEVRGGAITARADRDRLVQILVNLLHNAVKFTPSGGLVSVAVRRADSRAEIRVTDTGIGIEPSMLAKIFDPFVQIDRRRTTRHEGIGLGLTISRHLARAMGGDLIAESTLGAGATFVITLRLA